LTSFASAAALNLQEKQAENVALQKKLEGMDKAMRELQARHE
jgi:hypothetical protein